jgi:hypothetical protein
MYLEVGQLRHLLACLDPEVALVGNREYNTERETAVWYCVGFPMARELK